MKRYVVVGGLFALIAISLLMRKQQAQGWSTVYWGEPTNRTTTVACIERKVVRDPDTYNGWMTVCVATKEFEEGTLALEYTWDGEITEVLCFGMKGENVYLAMAKADTLRVTSLDRVAVSP